MIDIKCVSSLEKIFDETIVKDNITESECFQNEIHNFQIVLNSDTNISCKIKLETDLKVKIYSEKKVKGTKIIEKDDEFYFKNQDFYPDPLELVNENISLTKNERKVLWIVVFPEKNINTHLINISIENQKIVYKLNIFKTENDVRNLPVTDWVHYDSICNIHKVEPFTNEFYNIFKSYLSLYCLGGNNMLFTPVFTPTLDVKEGNYRDTIQLLIIKKVKNKYYFDFSKLNEFIHFAQEQGVKYFELSHIFTQWGAKKCPKIVDEKNNVLFGWENSSESKEYKNFLKQYFKALKKFVKDNKYNNIFYIHLSDEPNEEHADTYIKLSKFVKKYLKNFCILDAILSEKIIKKSKTDYPVISNVESSLIKKLDNDKYFFYYACCDYRPNLTNRFLYFPLQRVRMLGLQLFLNKVCGFLHWGFNYYFTQYSLKQINPYEVTDAGGAFPSGDSFIVYADEKNINPSLRLFVIREAYDDYYLLKSLEKKFGYDYCKNLLNQAGFIDYTVKEMSSDKFLELRKNLNSLLK